MILLDGKTISTKLKSDIRNIVNSYKDIYNSVPILTTILVGDDPASKIYVRNKEKACEECGFISNTINLPENITQNALNLIIKEYASKSDGLIVQLPLPNGLNSDIINNYPDKDVDGFTRINLGKLFLGEKCYVPATPLGITILLEEYHINTENKNIVIIGRSNIVGKPLASLLMNKPYNGNVTVLHSKTDEETMHAYCKNADIIIVAIGKSEFLNYKDLKEDCVIIDVGINRDSETKKITGDVSKDIDYVAYKTPVPGGVGPMTICGLMRNTLESFENKHKENE